MKNVADFLSLTYLPTYRSTQFEIPGYNLIKPCPYSVTARGKAVRICTKYLAPSTFPCTPELTILLWEKLKCILYYLHRLLIKKNFFVQFSDEYALLCAENVWVEKLKRLRLFAVSIHLLRPCTVRPESRCILRLRYVDLFVSIEVAVEVCCCFTVFSCKTAVEVQYR
jgi:hypothetical protein